MRAEEPLPDGQTRRSIRRTIPKAAGLSALDAPRAHFRRASARPLSMSGLLISCPDGQGKRCPLRSAGGARSRVASGCRMPPDVRASGAHRYLVKRATTKVFPSTRRRSRHRDTRASPHRRWQATGFYPSEYVVDESRFELADRARQRTRPFFDVRVTLVLPGGLELQDRVSQKP